MTVFQTRRGVHVVSYGVQSASRRRLGATNGLLNNLIAYWPSNEASGNLIDAHTNGLDLTDVNTVTSRSGVVYPTMRSFDRSNDEYFERPGDDALLSTGDNDWTVMAWVRQDTYGNGNRPVGIYSKHDLLTGQSEILVHYWHYTGYYCYGLQTSATGSTLDKNLRDLPMIGSAMATRLIICWMDRNAGEVGIQTNNGTVHTLGSASATLDGTVPVRIGTVRGTALNSWDGGIGPVAFWKSAPGGGGVLTADQRTALWNSGAGLQYSEFTS